MANKKYDYIRKTFTVDGKRYTVRGKTEAEVAVKEDRKRREIAECANHSGGNQTVKEWAMTCYDIYRPSASDASRNNVKSLLRCTIYPHIGSKRLRDVTPIECQRCVSDAAGKSQYYINRIIQTLRFIFTKAVENGYIAKSPADSLVRPRGTVSHRRALTEAEQTAFVEALKSHPKRLYFGAMLYAGCRPSEAAGLMWDDITEIEGRPCLHIRGTKTANADRLVPIPPNYAAMLDEVPKSARRGYLCTAIKGGQPLTTERSRQRAWHSITRDININLGCTIYRNQLIPPFPFPEEITPYCLRHTYCTNLARAGVDIRTAQKLMGHSDISLTANIYTHVDNRDIVAAADKINF